MKKVIIVDGQYEYDYILEDGNIHSLYYSHSECWSEHLHGQLILSIIDTENELVIDKAFNKKIKNKLDYVEFNQLYVLMKCINKQSLFNSKYEIGTLTEF